MPGPVQIKPLPPVLNIHAASPVVQGVARNLLFSDRILNRYGLGDHGPVRHALLAPVGLPPPASLPNTVSPRREEQPALHSLISARATLAQMKEEGEGYSQCTARIYPQEAAALKSLQSEMKMSGAELLSCLIIREHTEMEGRNWQHDHLPLLQHRSALSSDRTRVGLMWRIPIAVSRYLGRLQLHYSITFNQLFRLLIARAVAEQTATTAS